MTEDNPGVVKACLELLAKAINRYQLLEKYSPVLVGVSGGVDSLSLLYLLNEYNKKYNMHWQIYGCHIVPDFPDWHSEYIERFFSEHKIPCKIVKAPVDGLIKNIKNRCYFCSRQRRKRILEIADDLNVFRVALAHHKEDVAESLLLNMIYNGEISVPVPKQSIIQGRFYFIRPLYYFEKGRIEALAREVGLPGNRNQCPYYKESKRELVRNFLKRLKKENPDVYKNIFRSIFHINRAYMP